MTGAADLRVTMRQQRRLVLTGRPDSIGMASKDDIDVNAMRIVNAQYLNFCPRLKEMLTSGRSIDRNGEIVEIGGTSTVNNIRVIREILLARKPSRTLEVGLGFGASALTILATLRENRVAGAMHTAIDPFQVTGLWRASGLRVVADEGHASCFRHLEEFSCFALPRLAAANESFDFIYVDGSHRFEDVFIDFYYASKILRVGGIVLFDDCIDRHVRKVIDFIHSNYSEILSPLDLAPYDGGHKELRKRLANKLGVRQLFGFSKIAEPPRGYPAKLGRF